MKPKLSENKMLAFRTEEVHVQLVPGVQTFIVDFFKQMNLFVLFCFYRFLSVMFKAEILSALFCSRS